MEQILESPDGEATIQSSNPPMTTSLYIGDLDHSINDSQLYDLFSQIGQIVSVRVCKDMATQQSLGYGYVNFTNHQYAKRALDELNFTLLNNKPIRIMYSQRDPSIRNSGIANVFIKNLDKAIDNKALHETFSSFGNILSCKIATDSYGDSKGYGFVQFENEESAQNAINMLNGMLINDKQVYVGHFLRKQERENVLSNKTKYNNVYVKNLSESMTEYDLKKFFGEYGTITSAVVMRDVDGNSRCFGFVNFKNEGDASQAIEALNGKKFDDKKWYVGIAQKKYERELELKEKYEQRKKETANRCQDVNLYLKNLDDSVGDEILRELFSEFGAITSCKVVRDPHGKSRRYGFVAFSTRDEAARALGEMNGKMVAGKPLYVALAHTKDERRATLQVQYSQRRPVATTIAPNKSLYPHRALSLTHPFSYGQKKVRNLPVILQAGFCYQHQLVHAIRLGVPLPNFFVPMVQQGQQSQRRGGHQGVGPTQRPYQPVPLLYQQMPLWGHAYNYFPGWQDVLLSGVVGGMLGVTYGMGGFPIRHAAMHPMHIQALATALSNASSGQQRTMLGEVLFPLVDKLEHDAAAKVTGMLLELDQPEILHLIESPNALREKVAEAMDVLRNFAIQQANNASNQQASPP